MSESDTGPTQRWLTWRIAAIILVLTAVAFVVWSQASALDLRTELALGILAAQGPSLVCLLLLGQRVSVLNGSQVSFSHGVKASALAMSMSLFLPSRLSDGLKPLYLLTRTGLPLSRGISAAVVERFLDLVCVALALLLATSLATAGSQPAIWETTTALAAVIAVGVLAIGVVLKAPQFLLRVVGILPVARLRALLEALVVATHETVKPRPLFLAFLLSIALWLASYSLFLVFLRIAGSQSLGLEPTLVVFALSAIGLAVAIAPGGLGTFEAAMVVALGAYGYDIGEALVLAVVLRLAVLCLPTLLLLWMIWRGEISIGDLVKRLRRPKQSVQDTQPT